MELNTRVFELYKGKYRTLSELARAMGISTSQIYRVRRGKRRINEKVIIGAIKAFPGYSLDDLFYADGQLMKSSNKWPEFREYARQKYPNELDEGLITMIEDLIERQRAKRHSDDGK